MAHPVPPQGKSKIEYLRVCVRAPPPSPPQGGVDSNDGGNNKMKNYKILITF